MPTGEKTFRSLPPQLEHSVSGSSLNFWTASRRSSHAVHAYWYVGTGPSYADAGTHGQRLLNGNSWQREAGDSLGWSCDQPHALVVGASRNAVQQLTVI